MTRNKNRIRYGGVSLGSGEIAAVESVLHKNQWGLADEGAAFECELAAKMGVCDAIFVSSGSAAFELGMAAVGLPKNSEVIVPACTFPTPVASLIRQGYVPVVADIELQTNFLDPEAVMRVLSEKTRAILLVYVAGNVGQLERLLEIARQHHLIVIEDNSDGFGGTWNGQYLGSFGHWSVTSTHAAHIISTGQGGVLFAHDTQTGHIVRGLRDWGRISQDGTRETPPGLPHEHHRYAYDQLGYNFQPLELQAAMGRVQLRRLANFKRLRQRNFKVLMDGLKKHRDKIILPRIYPEAQPSWFSFPFVLRPPLDRAALVTALGQESIEWRPILAGNIARQPAFNDRVVVREALSQADAVLNRGLWLPLHPEHSVETMEWIADVVCRFLEQP